MALKIQKKERETSQSLVRRFTLRVRESGILRRAKKTLFYQPSLSRLAKKKAALKKEKLKKEYEKLRKIGKIE